MDHQEEAPHNTEDGSASEWKGIRRGPRRASHKRCLATPSKKQVCILEGLSCFTAKEEHFVRTPLASQKMQCGAFHGSTPFAPSPCQLEEGSPDAMSSEPTSSLCYNIPVLQNVMQQATCERC